MSFFFSISVFLCVLWLVTFSCLQHYIIRIVFAGGYCSQSIHLLLRRKYYFIYNMKLSSERNKISCLLKQRFIQICLIVISSSLLVTLSFSLPLENLEVNGRNYFSPCFLKYQKGKSLCTTTSNIIQNITFLINNNPKIENSPFDVFSFC